MRKEANEALQALLAELRARGSSPTPSGSGSMTVDATIKYKLQNAIEVMQQGLVERDTEVTFLAAFDAKNCRWGCQCLNQLSLLQFYRSGCCF